MRSALTDFLAKGGLDEGQALCWFPGSEAELHALYADTRARGKRLTLVGARKSFGGHFLCPPGAEACDVGGLARPSLLVERASDDTEIWVSVAAGVTFKELLGALRGLGVDPRLTVCHQTWCFPREQTRDFMRVYWDTMRRYPGIERRAEQQDMIALQACRWRAHGTWGNGRGSGFITPSLAVRRGSAEHARAEAFFSDLARAAFALHPSCKVMLLKQSLCDDGLLREMHAPYLATLRRLKHQVDPHHLLTSKLLHRLLGHRPP